MENRQYVFGPVPSRRLGRSLGVDLIPPKTCSFDCIYCQIGRTTNKTIERREYVPLDIVVEQIEKALTKEVKPDYITLAGSGEPTLYSKMGELIDAIHKITDVPVDILTNGSLLWDERVLSEAAKADLIIPSLDFGDAETLRKINRPAEGLDFDKIISGLQQLCNECREKVWIEVFIVKGINDSEEHIKKIADIIKTLKPTKVQLNTAVRPTAESYAAALQEEQLNRLAEIFEPRAEIIADFPEAEFPRQTAIQTEEIVEMLKRRPCTLDDIAKGLGAVRNEIIKVLEVLTRQGRISTEYKNDKLYYVIKL